mmetsp:Transcript_112679/g.351312  ORF Transcript_112679/g.351312 Transcript_112679/m.351312 type:complete len:475 (+) Transcript_112679:36-1460(+)
MAVGRADEAPRVFRLRDIPMPPERGIQRGMRWMHFEGSVQLRVLLDDTDWHGVTTAAFEVMATANDLSVQIRHREEERHPLDAMNGRLRREIDPHRSWFGIERNPKDPSGPSRVLLIELAKLEPGRAWTDHEIFHEELFQRRPFTWRSRGADRGDSWVKVHAGRPLDVPIPLLKMPDLVGREVAVGQSEDAVQLDIFLHAEKLEEVLAHAPPFRLFGVDCTATTFSIFTRVAEGRPFLVGKFSGEVIPDETSMKITDGFFQDGAHWSRPCLSIRFAKAEDFQCEWEEPVTQETGALSEFQELPCTEARSFGAWQRIRLLRSQEQLEDDVVAQHRGAGEEEGRPEKQVGGHKDQGDRAFEEGRYRDAIVSYTRALRYAGTIEEKILCNRSAAFGKVSKFQLALADAEQAVRLAPKWSKPYFRKGQALEGMKRFDEAMATFKVGQDLDPGNDEWKKAIYRVRETKAAFLKIQDEGS